MDTSRLNFLRELNLKKEKYELVIQRLRQNQREYNDQLLGDNNMDESDHAQREISVINNYNLIEKNVKELKKVERLIGLVMKESHFGECEECGDPIPLERLLIVPGTTLCVACQRDLEREGKIRGMKSRSLSSRLHNEGSVDDSNELDDLDYDFSEPENDKDLIPFLDPDSELAIHPAPEKTAFSDLKA